MANKYRDIYCGEVTKEYVGKEIRLAGWIENVRNLGSLVFITLRDEKGVVQLISNDVEKYSSLNANYLLKWYMIEDYSQRGFKYINFNAIAGEFEVKNDYSGLNESKLGFNTTVTEYIGEFDIILNQFSYNLYKNFKKGK